jgi:hypothetical protein
MSVDLYYPYSVAIGDPASDPDVIDGVSDIALQPGIRLESIGGDGAIDPTFICVGQQSPVIPFTTAAIATALGTIGIDGLELDGDSSLWATVFWQKGAESGARAGTLAHLKETVWKGYIVPRQIRATQTPPATLTFDILCFYDQTYEPIVYATAQTLVGIPLNDEIFVAGRVDINGTDLDAVTDITIDFGLNPETLFANGLVWPIAGSLATRRPSISIGIKDAALLNTYGLDGTAITGSSVTAFLKRCTQDGTRDANSAFTHISCTMAAGIITVDRFQASGNASASGGLRMTPRKNSTDAIIEMATGVQIT